MVCSEQPVTSGGAELAPRRKERWRGASEVLFIGLGELSWKVVVTFMDVLSPQVEIPWGRGPQLEPDVHNGTASSVPRQLLQGGLVGRRALQSSSAGRTCCQYGTSQLPPCTLSRMCAAGGGEERVFISSLRSVLWLFSRSYTAVSSEDGIKR